MSPEFIRALLMQALYQQICERAGVEVDRAEFLRAVVEVGRQMGLELPSK